MVNFSKAIGTLQMPTVHATLTGAAAAGVSLAKVAMLPISISGAATLAGAAFLAEGTKALATAQLMKFESLQTEGKDNLNWGGKALVLTATVAATVAALYLGTAFAGAGFSTAIALGTATVAANTVSAARLVMELVMENVKMPSLFSRQPTDGAQPTTK